MYLSLIVPEIFLAKMTTLHAEISIWFGRILYEFSVQENISTNEW